MAKASAPPQTASVGDVPQAVPQHDVLTVDRLAIGVLAAKRVVIAADVRTTLTIGLIAKDPPVTRAERRIGATIRTRHELVRAEKAVLLRRFVGDAPGCDLSGSAI